MPKYEANKTDSRKVLHILQLNGLTFDQAVDLKEEAEGKRGEKAIRYGGWIIAHTDGTYSSGAA